MSYEPDTIAQYLIDSSASPWSLAPKVLSDAKSKHDAALVANLDNDIKVKMAKKALADAEQEWDIQGRQNARNGKPVPSQDTVSLAKFNLANANEDLELTTNEIGKAAEVIHNLLAEEALRDEWVANLAAKAKTAQAALEKVLPKVLDLVAEVTSTLGHVPILEEWPLHLNPAYPHDGGAIAGLHALLNVKPSKRFIPQAVNAPVIAEPRIISDETFYFTAPNGNVQEAQETEINQILLNGSRLSSPAEIEAYKLANNIN
jgi:hypothetical protein